MYADQDLESSQKRFPAYSDSRQSKENQEERHPISQPHSQPPAELRIVPGLPNLDSQIEVDAEAENERLWLRRPSVEEKERLSS